MLFYKIFISGLSGLLFGLLIHSLRDAIIYVAAIILYTIAIAIRIDK